MTTPTDAALVETTTADSFDSDVLKAAGPTAVEFMSYGCTHCRTIEPVVIAVAKALLNKVRFVRVNVGIDQALANDYNVAGTPTFVMFLDGEEVGRVEGPQPSYAAVMSAITKPFDS